MITTYYIKDDKSLAFHSILYKFADYQKKIPTQITQQLIDMVIEKNAGNLIEIEHKGEISLSYDAKLYLNKIVDKYIKENV